MTHNYLDPNVDGALTYLTRVCGHDLSRLENSSFASKGAPLEEAGKDIFHNIAIYLGFNDIVKLNRVSKRTGQLVHEFIAQGVHQQGVHQLQKNLLLVNFIQRAIDDEDKTDEKGYPAFFEGQFRDDRPDLFELQIYLTDASSDAIDLVNIHRRARVFEESFTLKSFFDFCPSNMKDKFVEYAEQQELQWQQGQTSNEECIDWHNFKPTDKCYYCEYSVGKGHDICIMRASIPVLSNLFFGISMECVYF